MENLFDYLKGKSDIERFDVLFEKRGVRIERIISTGQHTPEGTWLEQKEDEWVVLLEGGAEVSFEDTNEIRNMDPGSFVYIEANRRHRVESTDENETTIWLAVHIAQ